MASSADVALRACAFVCASFSLAALLAHVFRIMPMAYCISLFGAPSVLLIFAMAGLARVIRADGFLRCLAIGLAGGVAATVAYDAFRWGLTHSGLFDYDGFKAIYIFGSWITGQGTGTRDAAIAGWIYHYWNGISFALMYALMFVRPPWLYGVGYGVFMELCMLGLFPMFLQVSNRTDFIIISLLGHVVYGATLGVVAQRYGGEWRPA
jgi:hypothetical protein